METTKERETQKSELLDNDNVLPVLDLTDDEAKAISAIKTKLMQAQMQRNQPYPEFGHMTYLQRFENNRNKAHTILPPKKNENDVMISSGTLEQKLEAVLSAVNNLNLSPKIKAFDKNKSKIVLAGTALEDAIEMTEELENDEEKKLLRQKELLIQGEVFVEERWVNKFKIKKDLNTKNFDGKFRGVKWSQRLEKIFEGPERTVKYGPNVYLGSITTFDIGNQPYIGIVEVKNYSEVEAIFGSWERWKYVSETLQAINPETTNNQTISQSNKVWSLNSIGVDQVEVAVYQDAWNNELQILLNGTPMLPVGFPLSAISPNGNYTIEKQVLKPIDNFAYGRGFIQSVEKTSDLLDEMLRLMVLKTRKSFMPAYINTSKRVISARVLQPGNISMGIAADALHQIGDQSEGVTSSEFAVIRELSDRIDRQTVSPQFTGQQGKSGTTATEVMELQRQAKMTMGLIIFACALLEKKIGYLRLYNILENWYKPIQKIVLSDQPQYRITSRSANIPGAGMGERQVIPMAGEIPTSSAIRAMEINDEAQKGFPVQKIFMNPEEMRRNIDEWYIVIDPKEKDTSTTDKLMFREMLTDLSNVAVLTGSRPNAEMIEEEFARVFQKDKTKLFTKANDTITAPMVPGQGGGKGIDPNAMLSKAGGMGNVAGIPSNNNIPVLTQ
jgi:hypothetical protein